MPHKLSRIYYHNFWRGFNDKTDANHIGFFQELFKRTLNKEPEIGTIEDSDILVETVLSPPIRQKRWKATILFSGEVFENAAAPNYTAVLSGKGKQDKDNRIPLPLFISFLYCNPIIPRKQQRTPQLKSVLILISNPFSAERISAIERMERAGIPLVFAGKYRNSIGGPLQYPYWSSTFRLYVSQFKFVLCMENSKEDYYITEKLFHGFLTDSMPIYWGGNKISEFIDTKSIVYIENIDSYGWIDEIKELMNNDELFLEKKRKQVLKIDVNEYIDSVAEKLKEALNK